MTVAIALLLVVGMCLAADILGSSIVRAATRLVDESGNWKRLMDAIIEARNRGR